MDETPDTESERLVELRPDAGSTIGLWLLLLAGPVVWVTHFGVVYLAAEAACTAEETSMTFFGSDALVLFTVAATAVAAAATIALAVYAWRRSHDPDTDVSGLATAGILLSLGSLAAVLVVGLPALALDVC